MSNRSADLPMRHRTAAGETAQNGSHGRQGAWGGRQRLDDPEH